MRAPLGGERAHQIVAAGFGDGRWCHEGAARRGVRGTHVQEDAATPTCRRAGAAVRIDLGVALDHALGERRRDVDRAVEHGAQDAAPGVGAEVFGGAGEVAGGVVDDHRRQLVVLGHAIAQRLDRVRITHVEDIDRHAAARVATLLTQARLDGVGGLV